MRWSQKSWISPLYSLVAFHLKIKFSHENITLIYERHAPEATFSLYLYHGLFVFWTLPFAFMSFELYLSIFIIWSLSFDRCHLIFILWSLFLYSLLIKTIQLKKEIRIIAEGFFSLKEVKISSATVLVNRVASSFLRHTAAQVQWLLQLGPCVRWLH